MRKGFLMVLAVALVAAMASPAMADLSTGGFIRIKGHSEANYRAFSAAGFQGGSFILPGKDIGSANYVEQRTRFFFDWKSENVGGRALFEVDFGAWGDSAYTVARNQGAGLEGDSINLETMNIYMWFKVPDTSLQVTAGLQNVTDSFGGMIFGYADMAAIMLTGKYEPVSWKLGWGKFMEGTSSGAVGQAVGRAPLRRCRTSRIGPTTWPRCARVLPSRSARPGLGFIGLHGTMPSPARNSPVNLTC